MDGVLTLTMPSLKERNLIGRTFGSQDRQTVFAGFLPTTAKNIDKTIQKPNHEQFISFCGKENLLHYRALEWEKQPVFAIAYLSCKGVSTIDALLSVDFNQFF